MLALLTWPEVDARQMVSHHSSPKVVYHKYESTEDSPLAGINGAKIPSGKREFWDIETVSLSFPGYKVVILNSKSLNFPGLRVGFPHQLLYTIYKPSMPTLKSKRWTHTYPLLVTCWPGQAAPWGIIVGYIQDCLHCACTLHDYNSGILEHKK